MHIMYYVDTIKITKYLKVLQHVSDHTGSIISSGVPGGGSGVQTPPGNSEGPSKKIVPNSTRLSKQFKKLLNLERQHIKMFGKKRAVKF